MMFKVLGNLLSIAEKTIFDNMHHLNISIDYLSNRLNPNMNNLLSIDYSVRDWIDDTDLILPRVSEEFPRLAEDYTTKRSINKPWGDKSDPIYIEPFLDEN
jgi:hypothetical protein